ALSITAIVGRSGAGKSTTADILIELLRPTSGSITVDGNEINESNIHSWRKSIGYVPQDAFILNDTIRENLLRFNCKCQ
ncbi:MAG: ATP-binding cassette domain-containing protein, partial [Bacteroidales bacterium]|nr:ATP-binding cassette domain-containing protein [Bacteroidales bacterium]